MKIQNQICSLKLSKQLKELNVSQESVFYWTPNPIDKDWDKPKLLEGKGMWDEGKLISAFTVSELGELLPKGSYTYLVKYENDWRWNCKTPKGTFVNGFRSKMNEADARARMLIYLIENKK